MIQCICCNACVQGWWLSCEVRRDLHFFKRALCSLCLVSSFLLCLGYLGGPNHCQLRQESKHLFHIKNWVCSFILYGWPKSLWLCGGNINLLNQFALTQVYARLKYLGANSSYGIHACFKVKPAKDFYGNSSKALSTLSYCNRNAKSSLRG